MYIDLCSSSTYIYEPYMAHYDLLHLSKIKNNFLMRYNLHTGSDMVRIRIDS